MRASEGVLDRGRGDDTQQPDETRLQNSDRHKSPTPLIPVSNRAGLSYAGNSPSSYSTNFTVASTSVIQLVRGAGANL